MHTDELVQAVVLMTCTVLAFLMPYSSATGWIDDITVDVEQSIYNWTEAGPRTDRISLSHTCGVVACLLLFWALHRWYANEHYDSITSSSSDESASSDAESSDDETDEIYRVVNQRADAQGYKPKDCGASGSCFYQSVATFKGRDAVHEGRAGPLRNEVVDKIRQNKWVVDAERLRAMRDPKEYIESDMEVSATCQVLGINIRIVGKSEDHDVVFLQSGSRMRPGETIAGETAVLLHYDTSDPHYVLGVKK